MKTVWKFTNKRELTEREFVEYFERKVRSTIRKYNMPISPAKSDSLNAKIINSIIKALPERKGKTSEESLDDISLAVLNEIIHGKAENLASLHPKNQPLYFLSDKEIVLYAKIKGIKGKIKKRAGKEEKINNFIKKIEEKNPDIRHNIIKSLDVFS